MTKSKFLTLDAIRGVAALAVVFWHAKILGVPSLPSAYLAVDLFFLMSGIVIALAYEERLKSDLSILKFMSIRFKRLYPLYILGTLLYLAFWLLKLKMEPSTYAGPPDLIGPLLAGIFFIPLKSDYAWGLLYPLSPVAWSLFFELVINVLYAVLLPWLSNRTLLIASAAGAILLAFFGLRFHTFDMGWGWSTFIGGLGRILFSFSAGVLLYRYRETLPRLRLPTYAILALVIAALSIPSKGQLAPIFTLAVLYLGFPAICILAIQVEPTRLSEAFAASGALSYSLYALHHPLVRWANAVAKVAGIDLERHAWAAALAVLGIVVACWLALKFFDEPARRYLSKRPKRNVTEPAAAL